MKKIPFFTIVVALSFVVIYLLLSILNKDEIHLAEEASVENASQLIVYSPLFDVKLLPTKDVKLQVKLTGQVSKKTSHRLQLQMKKNGSLLHIGYALPEDDFHFLNGLKFSRATLTVAVPEKEWEQIHVQTEANDVEIHHLTAKEMRIETASGHVDVKVLLANTLHIEAKAGNQTIHQVSSNDFYSKTTSGAIELNKLTSKRAEIESTSGNQSIKLLDGETIELQSTSGKIHLANSTAEHTTIKSTTASIQVNAQTPLNHMELTSTTGNIALTYQKKVDNIRVAASSDSGKSTIHLDEMTNNGEFYVVGAGTNYVMMRSASGDLTIKN